MTIWSSNGDINAGEGAKTTSAVPQPNYQMDPDVYFLVNPASEVTGRRQTIPDAPSGNVYRLAPASVTELATTASL